MAIDRRDLNTQVASLILSFFFFFPGKASKVNIYIHIKRFSEHHLSLTAKIWPPKKATRQFVVCLSWRALFTRLQVFTSQEAA